LSMIMPLVSPLSTALALLVALVLKLPLEGSWKDIMHPAPDPLEH
jgi:hypothetical protein